MRAESASSKSLPTTAATLACLAVLVSCIDRSNPFDPLNFLDASTVEVIREEYKPRFEGLSRLELELSSRLQGYWASYREDSAKNEAVRAGNPGIAAQNDQTTQWNAGVEAGNQPPAELLRHKELYVEKTLLRAYGPYPGFTELIGDLLDLKRRISDLIDSANARTPGGSPIQIYPKAARDSLLGPVQGEIDEHAFLKSVLIAANEAARIANREIAEYNEGLRLSNKALLTYNATIDFRMATKGRAVLGDPAAVQDAVVALKPSDTLFLGPGTFPVRLQVSVSGTATAPVVIRGYPGDATVLTPRVQAGSVLDLSNQQYVQFVDLVFRNGVESGVKILQSGTEEILFRNCLFDSNGREADRSNTGGLYVAAGSVRLEKCRFLNNHGFGVKFIGDNSGQLVMQNVLVARNRGLGMDLNNAQAVIFQCTFANNDSSGIRIGSPNLPVLITKSVFAFNRDYGISSAQGPNPERNFVATGNDLYQVPPDSGRGNWNLAQVDSTQIAGLNALNYFFRPEFNRDYSLVPGSDVANLRDVGYQGP